MLADFNGVCMSAAPGHDKTPTRFWGIRPNFSITAETVLQN